MPHTRLRQQLATENQREKNKQVLDPLPDPYQLKNHHTLITGPNRCFMKAPTE